MCYSSDLLFVLLLRSYCRCRIVSACILSFANGISGLTAVINDGGAFLAVDDVPEMSPPNPHRRKTAAFVPFSSLCHCIHHVSSLACSPLVLKFVFCCAEVCIHVFLIPVHLLSGLPLPSPTALSEAFRILAVASRGFPAACPSQHILYIRLVGRCFPYLFLCRLMP